MKKRTKFLAALLSAAMAVSSLTGISALASEAGEEETRTVVDATGAEVEVPAHPEKIAISVMVLPNMVYALQGSADNIVSIPPAAYSGWEMSMLKDLAPELEDVDTTMVSDDGSANVEALAEAGVDLVLSFDSQTDMAEQLKALGIPCVLLSSAKNMDDLENLITMLGDALNCEDRAQQVISWYDETMDYFEGKADQVAALSEDEMPRVLHFLRVHEMTCFTGGMNPFITTLEGGQNFMLPEDVTEPTMETILAYDPEIIFLSNFDDVTPEDFYENRLEGQDWSNVSAVKNHRVYKVPCGLYRWAPPNTFEKPLYMKWTASIVQPDIFSDYDIRTEISDFYKDYYGYELSEEQMDRLLRVDLNE